jgi:hypothetical protein
MAGVLWMACLGQTAAQAQGFADLPAGAGENTYAIIVVNQDYDRELTYLSAAADNLDLATTLFSGLGLPEDHIFTYRDLDKFGLEDAIFALQGQMPKGAKLLFYFHGIGVHLTEAQENRAVLPGLNVRPKSETFLIERRIERASVPLQTLVDDLRRTQASEVFVIYDACAGKPFNGNRKANYWKVVDRASCMPKAIKGADILFGSTKLEQGDLLAALVDTLRAAPATSVSALDAALKDVLTAEYDLEDTATQLVYPDPAMPQETPRCLVPVLKKGQLSCPAPAVAPIIVPTPEPEVVAGEPAADPEGEQTADSSDAPDDVANVETTPAVPDAPTPSDQVVISAPAKAPQDSKITDAGKAQGNWYAAKSKNTCVAYLEFVRDFPGSGLFVLKARSAIKRLCSEEEKLSFAATAQPEPAPIAPEPTPAPEPETAQVDPTPTPAPTPDPAPAVDPEAETTPAQTEETTDVVVAVDVAPAPPETPVTPPKPPVRDSFKAWREARTEGTCQAYLRFNKDFAGTAFSGRAQKQIKSLCSAKEITAFEEEPDAPVEAIVEAVPPTPAPIIETPAEPEPETNTTENNATTPVEDPKKQPVVTESGTDAGTETNTQPEETTPAAPATRPGAYALLIVNDAYDDPALPALKVDGDLALMQTITQSLNIPSTQVKLLRNLSKSELEREVVTFSRALGPNADLLLYYAGHSLSLVDGGHGMVVPRDFRLPDTGLAALNRNSLRDRTITLKDLSSYIRSGRPRRTTLIFNGCGPAPLPKDLKAAKLGFLNATSCVNTPVFGVTMWSPVSAGQTTPSNDPGLFMKALSKALASSPSMRFVDINRTLTWKVSEQAQRDKHAQDPALVPDPRRPQEKVTSECFAPQQTSEGAVCTDLEGQASEGTPQTPPADDTKETPIKEPPPVKKPEPKPKPVAPKPVVSFPAFCKAELDADGRRGLTRDGVRQFQQAMNRLGCNVGGADGVWGGNSRRGFALFRKHASGSWTESTPSCDTVVRLNKLPKTRVCPLVCGSNSKLIDGKCVRNPAKPEAPVKPVVDTGSNDTTPTPDPKPKPKPDPKPEPKPEPKPTIKCKPLEKVKNGKCVPKTGLFSGGFN